MKAFLLQWIADETDEPDDAHTAIVLATNNEDAESAIYKHHVETEAHLRGTVRHWMWKEIPIIDALTKQEDIDKMRALLEKLTHYDVTEPTRES